MLMMASRRKFTLAGLALCVALATGCAATPEGQQQAYGAGIGAALGGLAGGLIGGDTKSALIGAATGALVGWGAVRLNQYHSSQVRSAQAEQRLYGLQAVGSPAVKIRSSTSAPEQVTPGQQVTITTDYSVALPSGTRQVSVEESWVLKKDGREIQTLGPQTGVRTEGGYMAGGQIPIPSNTPSGTYVVEHRVQAGSSYDSAQSVFVVL